MLWCKQGFTRHAGPTCWPYWIKWPWLNWYQYLSAGIEWPVWACWPPPPANKVWMQVEDQGRNWKHSICQQFQKWFCGALLTTSYTNEEYLTARIIQITVLQKQAGSSRPSLTILHQPRIGKDGRDGNPLLIFWKQTDIPFHPKSMTMLIFILFRHHIYGSRATNDVNTFDIKFMC